MENKHIFMVQTLFVIVITLGSQSLDMENKSVWISSIARYILYFTIIRLSKPICLLSYDVYYNQKSLDWQLFTQLDRNLLMLGGLSIGCLVWLNQRIFSAEFPLIFIAHLLMKYPELEQKKSAPTVNYGVGMACSFFEGYLMHVLPSDGANFVGFLENIRAFESREGVVFPVKKLFIIVTKSLFCPPDLKAFNKANREDLPYLEACQVYLFTHDDGTEQVYAFRSLDDVMKSVAGVKNRVYRNSAYKIYRPDGSRPVYLAAECATPIHTLYKVLKNRDLYEELSTVDPQYIVSDFMATLATIVDKSPDSTGKCEIVFFDDTDPEQNLATVLLNKIQDMVPNLEAIVSARR